MNPVLATLRGELWAMEVKRLHQFLAEIAALPSEVEAKSAGLAMPEAPPPYELRDGVAHISVAGPIFKSVPWVWRAFGMRATGTREVRSAIRYALADGAVQSIMLDVDSPGGTVAGVQELGDTVGAARGTKTVSAHISDLGASAAYWIASQAGRVTANRSAEVGSIGVYTVLDDFSRFYENAGVKTHVVASHELKGIGVEGAPITPSQLADVRRDIDGYTKLFKGAVAVGRNMSVEAVDKIATGQVWLGEEAKSLGLIDDVCSADEAHASAVQQQSIEESVAVMVTVNETAPRGAEESDMAENNANPAAVTADEGAEMKQLRAKLERLEAENKAASEALALARKAQREQMMASYKDRIAPAMQASVDTFAGKCGDDLASLEAFLKNLPVATRPSPIGAQPAQPEEQRLSDDDKEISELFGIDPQSWAKLSKVAYVDASSGKAFDENGNLVAVEVN